MTDAIEVVDGMQQIATDLRHKQRVALELLLMGYSDNEVSQAIHVRRETIWRWKHRDPEFQAALSERRATATDAVAERLRGMLDQAASVLQRALTSRDADPQLAISLLSGMGVLARGKELGQAVLEPMIEVRGSDVDENGEVERVIEAVEVEAGGAERRLAEGGRS